MLAAETDGTLLANPSLIFGRDGLQAPGPRLCRRHDELIPVHGRFEASPNDLRQENRINLL